MKTPEKITVLESTPHDFPPSICVTASVCKHTTDWLALTLIKWGYEALLFLSGNPLVHHSHINKADPVWPAAISTAYNKFACLPLKQHNRIHMKTRKNRSGQSNTQRSLQAVKLKYTHTHTHTLIHTGTCTHTQTHSWFHTLSCSPTQK